jgi:hypothetical protein
MSSQSVSSKMFLKKQSKPFPNTEASQIKGRVGKTRKWWAMKGKAEWVKLGSPTTLEERAAALLIQSSSNQPEQSGGSSGSESDQSSSSSSSHQSSHHASSGAEGDQSSSHTEDADAILSASAENHHAQPQNEGSAGADGEAVETENHHAQPQNESEADKIDGGNPPSSSAIQVNTEADMSAQSQSQSVQSADGNAAPPDQSADGNAAPPTQTIAPTGAVITHTFQFQRSVPLKTGGTGTKATPFHLLAVPDHPVPTEYATHDKMGMLCGPFKAQLLGEMCDIPDEIATDTTRANGVEKHTAETHNKDGTIRKESKHLWSMKNRAYPTLEAALEQIDRYAEHSLTRTSGAPHSIHDKKGCGVPCGVVWTARGSRTGNKGHYRIRWGYDQNDTPYTQRKKLVYGGTDAKTKRLVGRSPQMVYQPDFHDVSGKSAISKDKRKEIQTSLTWVWSGAISSYQSYASKGGFHNKNKWDGFDVSTGAKWETANYTDGGRVYFPSGQDHTSAERLEFARPPKSKTKKGKSKKASGGGGASAQSKADQEAEALILEQMMDELEADSDDEFDGDA